jgi:hypothetical protein
MTTNMTDRWTGIADALEAYCGHPNLSDDYLLFRAGVARAFAGMGEELGEPAEAATGSLSAEGLPLDPELLRRLFGEVRAILDARAQGGPDLSVLDELVASKPGFLPGLVRQVVFDWDGHQLKELAASTGLPLMALLLFGRTLAAPFVVRAAAGLIPGESAQGSCPTCGSPPGLARLDEEGRRELICSLCETRWAFARLECPFCRTTDPKSAAVLTVEGDEARRIEVCDGCRRYVKTVDQRLLPAGGQVLPFVEETITLPLDLLAEREGYVRRLY